MPNIQMTTLPHPTSVHAGSIEPSASRPSGPGGRRPLLREALGSVLRGMRGEAGRTLRDVAVAARVSPGYLSEIERGRKEASSELLAAVSEALDVSLGEILIRASLEVSPPGAPREPALVA